MPDGRLLVVLLAAGKGTRMKSALPKVLHGFAGRSLLGHALAAVQPLAPDTTAVVVGYQHALVEEHLTQVAPDAIPVVQHEQNGTGHAARAALDAVAADPDRTVLVLPGDGALITTGTLTALLHAHHRSGAAATLLTSITPDPTGMGRVVRDPAGAVLRVVEEKDATDDERAIDEINTSVYAFREGPLRRALAGLTSDNAQGEEYLTDVVGLLVRGGEQVGVFVADAAETAGVNDRVELAAAHRVYNDRLLAEHMRAGVTVVDPATTWVDASVELAVDAVLLPGTDLHGSTTIGPEAVVGPQTSLTDTTVGGRSTLDRVVAKQAQIGDDVTIGPFAYLRPGTTLADGVHIGTYVEVKNSDIGTGTKVPHLSYVGDATIGEHTNIGAATVFVNYDGVRKQRSTVGDHAKTGADNMFIAPVHIGDGAYTAAGSVIDKDVPPGALGVGRAHQHNVEGWVARRRPGTAADEAARAAGARAAHRDEHDGHDGHDGHDTSRGDHA